MYEGEEGVLCICSFNFCPSFVLKKHRDVEKSYITKQNDNQGEERSVLLYLYFSG